MLPFLAGTVSFLAFFRAMRFHYRRRVAEVTEEVAIEGSRTARG
jgi:hypothetical protein